MALLICSLFTTKKKDIYNIYILQRNKCLLFFLFNQISNNNKTEYKPHIYYYIIIYFPFRIVIIIFTGNMPSDVGIF